jgi:hypothetical protein
LETYKIFGDPKHFAITYRVCPEEYNYESSSKMAFCHCTINETLIGRIDEECYLPTWIHSLTYQTNRILNDRHLLFPKEFNGLSDREIFELILKSNQFEEEFHPDFTYLPQLDGEFWSRHHFTIDETIDGYLVYFYVKDDRITFLIEDETRKKKRDLRSYEFIFYTLELNYFLNIIDETTNFLVGNYPFLNDN